MPRSFLRVVQRPDGVLELRELLLEEVVLLAQLLVVLLQLFGDVLKRDITFDFTLLELLHTGLQLSELGLLALTECTLRSSVVNAYEQLGTHTQEESNPPVLDATPLAVRLVDPRRC